MGRVVLDGIVDLEIGCREAGKSLKHEEHEENLFLDFYFVFFVPFVFQIFALVFVRSTTST